MRIVELNTKLFNWVTIARYLYHVSKIGNQSNYTTVNYTISNWHRQGAPIVELPVLCCPLHVPYTSLTCPLPSILNCKKELSCSRSKGWASYLKFTNMGKYKYHRISVHEIYILCHTSVNQIILSNLHEYIILKIKLPFFS